jgi:hypothetical protein
VYSTLLTAPDDCDDRLDDQLRRPALAEYTTSVSKFATKKPKTDPFRR